MSDLYKRIKTLLEFKAKGEIPAISQIVENSYATFDFTSRYLIYEDFKKEGEKIWEDYIKFIKKEIPSIEKIPNIKIKKIKYQEEAHEVEILHCKIKVIKVELILELEKKQEEENNATGFKTNKNK